MKKSLISILICIIIMIMPMTTATFPIDKSLFTKKPGNSNKNTLLHDTPPDWAMGNFSGEWGISIVGIPILPLGWIEGYFSVIGITGRIEGVFAEFKDEEPQAFIQGFVILYNMIGIVGDIETGNGTFFMGLGFPNENGEYYYRISLIIGPSFYMMGTWSEFE